MSVGTEAPTRHPAEHSRSAPGRCSTGRSSSGRSSTACASSNPGTLLRNPVIFVVEVVSVVVTIRVIADIVGGGPVAFDTAIAARPVVHGAVRELRRGDGRGTRQGAGRRLAEDPGGPGRQAADADGAEETVPATELREGRPRDGVGRRADPGRRRDRRGHRLGRRVGDHRRVRAGDPRVGRRPLGRHRRHEGALGLDQGARSRPSRARRSSTG